MRIIQVVHQFLPRHLAGTEVYTYNLAKELSQRHQVWVYTREDSPIPEEPHETDEVYDGLPVRRVYFNPPNLQGNLLGLFLNRTQNKTIEAFLARFLEETQADVVHFQHLFKLSAAFIRVARQQGIPVVLTLHDYWFLCHNAQLLRPSGAVCSGPARGLKCAGCAELNIPVWTRWGLSPLLTPLFVYRTAALRACLQEADFVIAPSAFLRDQFVQQGFPAGRIVVMDNGTNTQLLLGWRKVPSDTLRFGYMGTIQWHKGVHTLVQAFNQINDPQVELRIHGEPSVAPAYFAEIQRLVRNPQVHFMGRFENQEVGRVLAEMDVLVVPSIWPENSPVTIHEANLAGVPVIASRLGGMPDLVQDGVTGLLFQPGDASDLAAKMRQFIEDRSLVERFRRQMPPVKSMEENAQELEAIYERLCKARRQA
jgi:glycosyltransferase involved in cell wall biosynthesis